MLLSQAIRQNKLSLAAAQTTYKQNVISVNTAITSVLSSNLPTLNQNPPDWNDFVTAYENADADALQWVNNVMARLLNVPDEVQSYNGIISQLLQDAKQQAGVLVSNPGNQVALAQLTQDLNGLSNQMNIVVTFISGAVTGIQQFKDVLPDMATQLNTIAQKSSADAKADQAKIDELRAAIKTLNADIKSLTASIIALGIADAIALTLGVVATIAAWPVGALTWIVLGPVVAVATTYIVIDAEKIKADKALIEAKEQQITGISADVATLQLLSDNYTHLAAEAAEVEDSLQAILAEWQILESDVNAAIADIRAAISDKSAPNFAAVQKDVNDAITAWSETYTQAGTLHLDLNVNTATLQLGMTQDQLKAQLATGQTLSILEYYNNVQRARRAA